jgi:chromosome segregation ATPase
MMTRSTEYEKIRAMTTAQSTRNQSIHFAMASLSSIAAELESIPAYFSRATANIGEALAGVQTQIGELNTIRNFFSQELEKTRNKANETEHAHDKMAAELVQVKKELEMLREETGNLEGQMSREKVDGMGVTRDRERCVSQLEQLQPRLEEVRRGIDAELDGLGDLKKAKKEAKSEKAGNKKRIDSLAASLMAVGAEGERLRETVSSLRKTLAAQQARGQSIANDSRVRESAPLQHKLISLQNAMDETQASIRFSTQTQLQLKNRIADRQSRSSSRICDGLKSQLQQIMADEVRFKLENQGLRRREAEIDRTFLDRQSEFSQSMEALNHEKTRVMEQRSALSARMSELQRGLTQEEDEIRRLTLAVNELTVSVELTKKRHAAAKTLKQHIKKTEAEMQSFTHDSQAAKVRYAKAEGLPGKTPKSRILKLD